MLHSATTPSSDATTLLSRSLVQIWDNQLKKCFTSQSMPSTKTQASLPEFEQCSILQHKPRQEYLSKTLYLSDQPFNPHWLMSSYPMAFAAEISKMFQTVELTKDEHDLHDFVWRSNLNAPLKDYQLTRVMSGVSATFAANVAVKQNAIEQCNWTCTKLGLWLLKLCRSVSILTTV